MQGGLSALLINGSVGEKSGEIDMNYLKKKVFQQGLYVLHKHKNYCKEENSILAIIKL